LSCKKYGQWVHLFWDKRLNQNQEEELKRHLAECKTCQEKLSFLESMEERAKGIRAKEPPEEYWDTFSSRVRKKIASSKEKSTAFGWKKAIANVFVLSPWKIRIATGLVSIVLVFIIGKLYVDYRGKTIIPKEPVAPAVKEAPLRIAETEKKEIPSKEETKDKTSPSIEQPKKTLPLVSSDQEKGKVTSPVVEGAEKQTGLKEQKISLTDKAAEEKSISIPVPVAEEKPGAPIVELKAGETPTQITEQPEAAPAASAGEEKKIEKPKEEIISSREENKQEGKEIQKKIKGGQAGESLDILSTSKPSFISAPSADMMILNEKPITRIKETDTLMQAVDLRVIIQRWKDQFQDHPSDSINDQGYLQVATAYFLLNRLSVDSTVINQGSYLIEQYMNRTKDPAIKDQLSDKLEKIKALGKK